ncbi:hypothetical protein Q7P37_005532 [Cladosporium fusiforme]
MRLSPPSKTREMEADIGALRPEHHNEAGPSAGLGSDLTKRTIGHIYHDISARDSTRLQLGDIYNTYNSFHGTNLTGDVQQEPTNDADKLLEALEFPQMELRSSSIAAAYANTCQWLFETPEYKSWRDPAKLPEHHGFFWIKGKPGAGKSTLMKCALRHARQAYSEEVSTSFFFNSRGDELEMSTEGMFRSLIYQLAKQVPSVSHQLSISRNIRTLAGHGKAGWPLPLLQNMFQEAIEHSTNNNCTVCYVDALDECHSEDDVREVVMFFEDLAATQVSKHTQLLVCFASRHYPRITLDALQELTLDDHVDHELDIASYLDKKLKIRDPPSRRDLIANIRQRASGVFLWVVLVVGILNKEADHGRQHLLQTKLQQIPRQLNDLFDEILGEGESNETTVSAIQWVLFSVHPLEPRELYVAIMVSTNQANTSSCLSAAENIDAQVAADYILSCSKGLLEIASTDGDNHRVQFIHETVKEYLLSRGLQRLDDSLSDNVLGRSHDRLARWSHRIFRLSQEEKFNDSIGFWYSMRHVTKLDSGYEQYPLRAAPLYKALEHAEAAAENGHRESFLLDSLPRFWEFSKKGSGPRDMPEMRFAFTKLQLLVLNDCHFLVDLELERNLKHPLPEQRDYIDACIVHPARSVWGTVLHLAVTKGRVDIAQALISSGADVNIWCNGFGTPLHAALHRAPDLRNCKAMIEMLFQNGAKPDPQPASLDSPLLTVISRVAADQGRDELVKILLDHGADANAECGRPLRVAVESATSGLVRLLLEGGADANTWIDSPALSIAVTKGDLMSTKVLLEHGAVQHATNIDRTNTALLNAIELRNLPMVKLLLEYERHTANRYLLEENPLHQAVRWSTGSIVELLLNHRADPIKSVTFYKAVAVARKRCSWEPVAKLLQHGATYHDSTAQAGRLNDWVSMRILAEHGIDVDADDFSKSGPYDDPKEARKLHDLCIRLHGLPPAPRNRRTATKSSFRDHGSQRKMVT